MGKTGFLIMMSPIEAEQFASRLRNLRKDNGYSQAEFARLLGISRRAMCYYERESKNLPPVPMMVKMAELLDTSMEDLIGIENKTDNRTIGARTARKLRNVALLPKQDRDLIFQLLDNLLDKNHISAT